MVPEERDYSRRTCERPFDLNQTWDLLAHWERFPPPPRPQAVGEKEIQGKLEKKFPGELGRKGPGQTGPAIRTDGFRLNSCLCTKHNWALPVLHVPVISNGFLCTLTCPSAPEGWQICSANADKSTIQLQPRYGPWLQGWHRGCRTLTNRL